MDRIGKLHLYLVNQVPLKKLEKTQSGTNAIFKFQDNAKLLLDFL